MKITNSCKKHKKKKKSISTLNFLFLFLFSVIYVQTILNHYH
jgi:hypothetical protein